MPERRKSKDELAAEIAARGDDADPAPDAGESFEAVSAADREAANAAFDILNAAGFATTGAYHLGSDDAGRTFVTLTAYLPHAVERDLDRDALPDDG